MKQWKVGDRLRFPESSTVWEITEIQERGAVIQIYFNYGWPLSPHKHLREWSLLELASNLRDTVWAQLLKDLQG